MSGGARSLMHAFGGPERDREKDLVDLARKLGVAKITGLFAIGDSKVLHVERTDGRCCKITLEDASAALTPRRVEEAFYAAADLALALGSRADWRPFAESIAWHAERLENPTDEDQTRSWVRAALHSGTRDSDLLARGNERELARRYGCGDEHGDGYWGDAAWVEGTSVEATVVCSLEALSSYITLALHVRGLGHKVLGQRLRAAGFASQKRCARIGGKTVQRRLWVIAKGRLLADEGEEG